MVVDLLGGLPFGGLRLGVIGIHEFEAVPTSPARRHLRKVAHGT